MPISLTPRSPAQGPAELIPPPLPIAGQAGMVLPPSLPASRPPWQNTPLTLATPETDTIYQRPIPGKIRGALLTQGTVTGINFTYLDSHGDPVDLTQFDLGNSRTTNNQVQIRLAEACNFIGSPAAQVAGTIIDAVHGQVSFTLPDLFLTLSGVYRAEAAVLSTETPSRPLLVSPILLMVERSLWSGSSGNQGTGLPTVQEMRLVLRDYPEVNLLLDHPLHAIADVCEALVQTILLFNATLPPLEVVWSSTTWPAMWKTNLIYGASGALLTSAANWYRISRLPVSVGGVQTDDLNKAPELEKEAERRQQLFEVWSSKTRYALNRAACFGEVLSGYSVHGCW